MIEQAPPGFIAPAPRTPRQNPNLRPLPDSPSPSLSPRTMTKELARFSGDEIREALRGGPSPPIAPQMGTFSVPTTPGVFAHPSAPPTIPLEEGGSFDSALALRPVAVAEKIRWPAKLPKPPQEIAVRYSDGTVEGNAQTQMVMKTYRTQYVYPSLRN